VKGTNGTVGVQGPGGGVIVYVDSTNEIPGYDYLEVAPTDGVFASSAAAGVWSTTTTTCGTAAGTSCHTALLSDASTAPGFIGLGTGRAATAAIVTRHNAGGVAKDLYAAGVADNYSTATASDWWLPSKDELKLLFVEAIYPWDACWSSSEFGAGLAWVQGWPDGNLVDDGKSNAYCVIPVRGF